MCGGFPTCATKMEGVSKYEHHYLHLHLHSGHLAYNKYLCPKNKDCYVMCKFRCIPGAISGICGYLWRTPVPTGDLHGPVHPGGGHHLLEEAMPTGRRYTVQGFHLIMELFPTFCRKKNYLDI